MESVQLSPLEPNAEVDGRVGLRASDEDRERLGSEIREHFVLGRLDADDLAARLGKANAASSVEELHALRADLPRLPASAAERRAVEATRRAARARRFARGTGIALLPFVACTVIWLLSGAHGSFWPMWVGLASALHVARRAQSLRA